MERSTKTASVAAESMVKDIWRRRKLNLYINQEKVSLTDGLARGL